MENVPMIYKSVIDVMKKINAIGKDRKNETQHFQYRGIDDVMNELHGALSECGVFVVPEVLEENRSTGKSKSGGELYYTRLKIRFTFYAADGSSVNAVVIGEAMDSGDKASNKALSIGLKYAMLQVFCIPTEDDKDPDAVSPQPQPESMKPEPKKPEPKKAAKFDFEPKGGETTPEEKKEIGALLTSKKADGKPVFSKDEVKAYSDMRKDFTAGQVIAMIKKELQIRMTPAQDLPPAVEAIKDAVDGEVVQGDIF